MTLWNDAQVRHSQQTQPMFGTWTAAGKCQLLVNILDRNNTYNSKPDFTTLFMQHALIFRATTEYKKIKIFSSRSE